MQLAVTIAEDIFCDRSKNSLQMTVHLSQAHRGVDGIEAMVF